MGTLQLLNLIVNLLPLLIRLIKISEEAMPGVGKGEQKLAYVRSILEDLSPEVKEALPIIEKVVSTTVTTMNKTGDMPATTQENMGQK